MTASPFTGKPKNSPFVVIRGAGEMATGVACSLFRSHIRRILMLEIPAPLAVRRRVAFSEAVHDRRATVEGIEAVKVSSHAELKRAWDSGRIAVCIDPEARSIEHFRPDVLIDATLAKRNLGISAGDAPLVVALGPGFKAGRDCHIVVETNRGESLGRLIRNGSAEPDTGIPAPVNGYSSERVLRSPAAGVFHAELMIGDRVRAGDPVGRVGTVTVTAAIGGTLRGLIRQGTFVTQGLKVGDIDPRNESQLCDRISDKARRIGCAVLEAIRKKEGL